MLLFLDPRGNKKLLLLYVHAREVGVVYIIWCSGQALICPGRLWVLPTGIFMLYGHVFSCIFLYCCVPPLCGGVFHNEYVFLGHFIICKTDALWQWSHKDIGSANMKCPTLFFYYYFWHTFELFDMLLVSIIFFAFLAFFWHIYHFHG